MASTILPSLSSNVENFINSNDGYSLTPDKCLTCGEIGSTYCSSACSREFRNSINYNSNPDDYCNLLPSGKTTSYVILTQEEQLAISTVERKQAQARRELFNLEPWNFCKTN